MTKDFEKEILTAKIATLEHDLTELKLEVRNNYASKESHQSLKDSIGMVWKAIAVLGAAIGTMTGLSGGQLIQNSTSASTPYESSQVQEP